LLLGRNSAGTAATSSASLAPPSVSAASAATGMLIAPRVLIAVRVRRLAVLVV
jgi:hypothetical protein